MNYFYSSKAFYAAESISQLFEGLMVKSNFNKLNTVAFSYSNSTDTLLVKLPGEKLHNPKKNTPFIFIKCIKKSDLIKRDIKSGVLLDLCNTDYIICKKDFIVMVSRPQRLDVNRINTLSKSEKRLNLAANVLYDTTLNQSAPMDNEQAAIIIGNAYRLALTVSISQMSLRDPLKYLFTLAIADTSDIKGFMTQKFKYHIKSVSDLKLFNDIMSLINEIILKLPDIKKENQSKRPLKMTEDTFMEGGWPDFNIKSPYTGMIYRDIKQLVNEILVNVYFVQKELHNQASNLEKLVEVPLEFEMKLKDSLQTFLNDDELVKKHQESHRCDIRICEEVRLMIRDRFIFTKKTFTKGCEFSYDPDLVMMTTRKRMLNELPKAELIRPKIEATEKLKHPLVMVDTLTSSKSSTKVRFSRFKDENMWIGDINTRKKIRNNQSFDLKKMNRTNDLRQRIIQEFDFIETLNDLKVVKARINTWNSIKYQLQTQDRSKLYGKHELIQSIDNLNKRLKMIFIQIKRQQNTKYIFNEEKFTEKVVMTGKDGFMTNEVPASEFNTYCKNTMDSAVVTETIPVKENIYDLIKRLKEVDLGDIDIEKMSVLDICKMALYWKGTSNKSLEYASVIRMFPKGQRTFADREIYILDIISKIRLYYVEHCYKHLDKINEYEAISIPGEAKSYHISNQELDFLISNTQLTTEQPRHEEIRLINHTNIDQSKWSAMDVPLKFVDAHFYMMSSKPSERLMMMDIQMDYMVKIISIPESVMQRKMIQHAKSAKVTDLIKKKGPIEICTDGYKRNYSIVTYNWLQGCLNYLSSFVHTCVMEYIKDVHEKYFHSMQEAEGFKKTKCTNFRSMVHSDDGTISSAVVMTDNIAEKFNRVWGSYSRFMFYLTDRMLKYFSINLNLMKTFCSEAIKDFISEFLVNGEFIGNYSRFIVNCCGDSNFKSAKEDLYMLMSSVQSMARRGSSLETLLVAVAVVNYHVYHTYSMAPNEMNDPMRAIRLLKLLQKPENLQKMKRNVMSKSAIEALTRLEGTKFIKNTRIEEDRNKLVTTLGGYCNPPLQLLAILGAKAGDAYILMDSFKQLSLNVQFHEMMANPESLTKTNVNYIIQSIMKQIGLIPDLNILISTFLLRQELGFINGRYSKFDMQRVNHVSLFTFPTMKIEEKFPVKYRSFQDFLTVAQNKNELMKLLLSIVEDSTNIVGKCKNSSHFLTRTKLDYQTTKKIDNYQTTTVATQRLNRLITTNHKVFLPINMLTGLEKIKISESLKAYKEDKLGLVDSKIHIKRAEYDAKRLTIEKFNRMEEFDDIDCYDEIEDLKRIKRELSDLESERAVLRELNDKRINEEKDYVTEIIALMSELSTNKILQEIEDVQKVGLSVTNNQQHYDEISEFEDKYNYMSIEKRDKFTPLRVKMRLNDAIIFMTLIGLYQPIQNLLESFIFTIISTIFNDKMMNYFLKVDIGTRRLNVEAMGIATLQMMVYPYQIRQLTYRAEDVVKGVLMDPGRLEIYIRDIKADETSFKRDMGIVQKIVVDLELQDSIEELKTIMRNYNNSKIVVNDESIFEIMTSIKRYGVLYNLILKTISLYNTKQAYSLSRARRVDIASKYFCDYKGNFIKSEKYVAMIMDHDALRNFHLEILTEHDNSIRSIKKALDAIVMLIEKTKRLIHKEIGPIDIILILKNSNFGKKNMWKYMMDNVEIINKNVHDISGYLPVLYNLGIINQFTVTKTLELNAVMPTWHEAHSVRRELLGDFSVTYRYARMLVYLSGVDRKFKQMVIVKDPVYNDPDNAGYNDRKSFSKIMNKVMKDFRLKPESLTTHKTNIVYMRKDKYRDAEFYRVQNVSDYPRGQLHSFSMVMEVEDKIVSLEESVPQDYAELIDFYDVYEGNRDILNLYAWSIKDMSMFNRESRINRKERSLLLNLDVDYDLINGHARLVYTPAELGVELQGTQSVMSRCIRAKNERLLELDVLSEKSIVINGLNLKFLYEWLRDTDENPKYYGELTHEKILSIAPCLYEFFYTIKALADEEEYSNDAIQTIHEAMMNKVSELVTERLETVVSMDDNDNEIMTPEVYRRVICNSAYQTLNVNILERFPARSMNLKGTIKILIKAILNMKGFRETIVKTGEASGLSDIKINKLLVEIFTLMFMLNDVLLLNSSFIKKLKVKVCQSLFSVTTSLITITYLKLIDTALDSGNIYGQSMSLLNKNYITDLKKLLNNAAVSYTSLLPMTPPEVGTSGPWKRMVQQAFIILTTDNIYNVETSSGEKYTSIIRNKLLEATEVLRCGLLSNDEIKDLETLAKPLEPAKSLR
ncbi:MAG: RNA-dependent RNA polymerase [Guiyang Tospo-like virus 1]|nr:MAG: RNA-dependent RNA polymerase [Guiyang Tospo-like virus 1]